MAVLSQRKARRRQKKLACAGRVAGPGVQVTEYGRGIGHSGIAGWLAFVLIGCIVVFVWVPILLGKILFPGVALVLIAVLLIRPHRGIAVTSFGILVMHESLLDGQPDKIVYMAPRFALGPLVEQLEWKRQVLVHIGAEQITLKRTVYESLLVAVDRLAPVPRSDRPSPVPSHLPSGWFHDPFARYQYRYWDGQQWTANVGHNGVAYVDSSI
jgi:hypothetical protein